MFGITRVGTTIASIGRSGAGGMAATMQDVARLAGVSPKTVSNYFNGYRYMTDTTRARIETAIDELNYKLNISARNLRSGKTGNISLVLPTLNQPYFADLANDVIRAAQLVGMNVFVETTDNDRDHELTILEGKRAAFVDGIIFQPVQLEASELRLAGEDFPMVLIGERVVESRADFVTMDNVPASRCAVEHLAAQGRRRIAAVGHFDAPGPNVAMMRLQGYQAALEGAGLAFDPQLVVNEPRWTRAGGADAISRLLDSGVDFDAVFAFNDALALGALPTLQRAGRVIPDDVAIVGFDDTEDARFTYPALTTINPGRRFIAQQAVELLLTRMGKDPSALEPHRFVADWSLVIRESA